MGSSAKLIYNLSVEKYRKQILNELPLYPHLVSSLGDKVPSFISWASKERFHFEADLIQEVQDFINKEFTDRKRMYNTNVKEWKRISALIFIRDSYTCSYCQKVGGLLEVDHIIPFSEGGSDEPENLTTACRKCNRQKRNKSTEEFLLWKNKNSMPMAI